MELTDLNDDERIAVVGLIYEVVLADSAVQEDELGEIEQIVEAFGEDGYQTAMDTFEERFSDQDGFKKFLKTIERQDARELIYGMVLEAASAGGIEHDESELLGWLSDTWKVEVKIVGEMPDGDDDAS